MKPERFENPSGRLVQERHDHTVYHAFVPNPLPPTLEVDTALVRALSDADRALGELAGLGRAIPNPHLLVGPFMRREAVLSSRIEGTQADIADLYAYEAGAMHTPGSDAREVLNYVRALNYGLGRLADLPIGLRLLKELHAHLMEGVRGEKATPGEFRRVQNYIGKPGCTVGTADFVPPPPSQMFNALEDLEAYLHTPDANPPLVRLAFVHYQFEAIHPFLDGNGRIGRLLVTLLLVLWDLLPLPLLYLSAYFEEHRDAYYDLLLAVSEKSAWGGWVEFFLRGVEEQAHDAIARAKRLQDLQREWRERLQQARMTGLVLGIADALFDSVALAPNEVAERFGVSHQAAMAALRRLEAMGIVRETTGRKRDRLYNAPDILKALE
jgi:Fic family protein